MRLKLPIGIQTFSKIRDEGYLYVDKTKEAYELITGYSYAFLSRPRRFGKSLFIDTLLNIFEGRKELFEGLYIYDKWDWEDKYPVIKISWAGNFRSLKGLNDTAIEVFRHNQKRLGIECNSDQTMAVCFSQLIKETYYKYNKRVVILIDEYDKPILDAIDIPEQARENREYIKSLYTVIKDNDEFIRFTFLTGVSKFSKASIFSGLNMLTDISLMPQFGNICGYTQNDIETTFREYLEGVELDELREWYNGYNFLKDNVYNPFDILQFIANNFTFKNYWFATGTPSFLIKLLESKQYFLPNLSNLVVDEKLLDSFDIDNLDIEVILYQSGYLTIDEMIQSGRSGVKYRLRFPNLEVRQSFNDYVIDYLYSGRDTYRLMRQDEMYEALNSVDLERFRDVLQTVFASIPYNNYVRSGKQFDEWFYSSLVYVYLQSMGYHIIGEDVTNKGRIDLTLLFKDKIYIFEFKVDSIKGEALRQIKEKGYAEKYRGSGCEIYLVGIEFDSNERNIVNFEWEKV